ncbi:MAG: hypothetical protein PHC64_03605 [Candidatus Gastranaerophilales bacterium]|nr:hypothetical protein [Candidatus Gastranaerophilales bacterium]
MKCTLQEFEKINELETSIITVAKLTEILIEYCGEKEFLIDILFEKTQIMQKNLCDFTKYLSN